MKKGTEKRTASTGRAGPPDWVQEKRTERALQPKRAVWIGSILPMFISAAAVLHIHMWESLHLRVAFGFRQMLWGKISALPMM